MELQTSQAAIGNAMGSGLIDLDHDGYHLTLLGQYLAPNIEESKTEGQPVEAEAGA
jgi:hypothetical protein